MPHAQLTVITLSSCPPFYLVYPILPVSHVLCLSISRVLCLTICTPQAPRAEPGTQQVLRVYLKNLIELEPLPRSNHLSTKCLE